MLKSLCFLLSLTLSTLAATVVNGPFEASLKSYDNLTVNGSAKLRLVKASSLTVKGSLEFNNLEVSGDASIIGSFKGNKGKFDQLKVKGAINADHVLCNDLDVEGPVVIAYLMVKDRADIKGSLNAKESKFNTLHVTGDTIILDTVQLNSLTVASSSENPVVTLKGSTIVNGDITFESGQGAVIQGSTVKIKGTVTGGDIKKEESNGAR